MQNLIASLAQQFGLRPEQIQTGVGAVLQLIQQHAGGADFQQLIDKIPGAQAWIQQAASLPTQASSGGGMGGGLLGQAAGILGAVTGQGGGGLAGVLGQLGHAGFRPESAAQFVPALLQKLKDGAGAGTVDKVLEQVPGLSGLGSLGGGLLGQFLK